MPKNETEKQMLRDHEVYPTDEVLSEILGRSYDAFQAFMEKLPEHNIEFEWRYYNDGKNWLGKAVYKKKTVFWLSVWDRFFKTTFFFSEKALEGVDMLPLSKGFKDIAVYTPTMGKLNPIVISIKKKAALADIFKLIDYKRGLK
jgi:hypothetical protein